MPTPPLQPAVFAPALRELPPPALDLFDLDECLASPASHLAQLTNKVFLSPTSAPSTDIALVSGPMKPNIFRLVE